MLRPLPLVLCALACVAVLPAAPALGAEPPAAAALTSETAITEHVRRGDKARATGRWADAAAAYADALAAAEKAGWSERQSAAILGELGAAEVALRKYREGAEHLHRSLLHEDDLSAAQRERLRLARKKAAGQVSILIVGVNPADAQITLDQKPLPESPSGRGRKSSRVLFLDPGQHTIRIALNGYSETINTVNLEKGTTLRLAQRLQRQAAVQAAPAGPAAPCAQPAGKPEGRPSAPCPPGRDWVADLRPGAFIMAGVGAGVGAGLLLATIPLDTAIEEQRDKFMRGAGSAVCKSPSPPAECEEQRARVTARSWLTGVGWVTVGVSGMLAAMAASSYLWNDPESAAPPVRFTAISTGQYTGAAVLGVW